MGTPELLLWAEALVAWSVANYSIVDSSFEASETVGDDTPGQRRRPAVRLLASFIAAVCVGGLSASWSLGITFAACAIPLAILRARWANWRMAEREVLLSAAFVSGSLAVIANTDLHVQHWLVTLNMPGHKVAVAGIAVALFAFTVQGGTYLVRAVLRTSGVPIPDNAGDAGHPSPNELKRGRLIGALERAVLFVVLIAGSYEALGFIVAAKGLIRSRDFEGNRDLTEYFLIGTLTSVAVAIATGTTARYLLQAYW